MQDVDAQHRCEQRIAVGVAGPALIRTAENDALGRTQVCDARICAPCGDALEVRVVDVAGPPRNSGCTRSECGGVLAGAAADFQKIAALRREKAADSRPNWLVVAVKSGRIQPAVRLRRLGGFTVFADKSRHDRHRSLFR